MYFDSVNIRPWVQSEVCEFYFWVNFSISFVSAGKSSGCFSHACVTTREEELGKRIMRPDYIIYILVFLMCSAFKRVKHLHFVNVCCLETILVAFWHFTCQRGLRRYMAIRGSVAYPFISAKKKKVWVYTRTIFDHVLSTVYLIQTCFWPTCRRINWSSSQKPHEARPLSSPLNVFDWAANSRNFLLPANSTRSPLISFLHYEAGFLSKVFLSELYNGCGVKEGTWMYYGRVI